MSRCFCVAVVLSALVLSACSDGPTDTPPASDVSTLTIADPLPLDAFVGRTLAPSVRVLDSGNRPIAGVTVHFASAHGTTTIAAADALTDANGIARPGAWQLPTRPTVDTLLVTVPRQPQLAPLRIHIGVRPGPVVRWTTLAPTSGEATVLQSALTGTAFQAFDPYDNPVSRVAARVETTPKAGDARVATTLDADANGVFRMSEWTPRTLGTHSLRLIAQDEAASASPTLTRTVREPACAPTTSLPEVPDLFSQRLSGVLRDNPATACADTVDRYAIGVDSLRFVRFAVSQAIPSRLIPFRIVRAGITHGAGVIVPDSARFPEGSGNIEVALPRGEYELIVGAGITTRTPYEVSWADVGATGGSPSSHVVPGVELERFITTANQPAPELQLPDAVGYMFIVPMRDPARREFRVMVTSFDDWLPVIGVSGRRDGSATRDSLAVVRGGQAARTLVVNVPVDYQEALVYVLQPKPIPQPLTGRFRIRID